MNEAQEERWRDFHDYEVSDLGRVRRRKPGNSTGRMGYCITPCMRTGRSPYYHLYTGSSRVGMSLRKLMQEVWPEVDLQTDNAWADWLLRVNGEANRKVAQQNVPEGSGRGRPKGRTGVKNANLRDCADKCGRRTNNYRCAPCWARVRRGNVEWNYPPAGYRTHVRLQ